MRLAPAFTILYGVLCAGFGTLAYVRHGSVPSVVVGGGLGVVLIAAGVLMLRGVARAWDVGQWATLAVVSVMLYRLVTTGGIVPAVPVMAAGLGLSFTIWSERPTGPDAPAA